MKAYTWMRAGLLGLGAKTPAFELSGSSFFCEKVLDAWYHNLVLLVLVLV